MTDDRDARATGSARPDAPIPDTGSGSTARTSNAPLLVEDVLLLLFQPGSGTIAGENILYYVLGGAVLGDLALSGKVELRSSGMMTRRVHALDDETVEDELLVSAFAYVSRKPRGVQTVLAAIGPTLRDQVLDRLVERGDIHREAGRALGIFRTTRLTLGSDRRAELMTQVREVLIDGQTPTPRVGASIALLSASDTLPLFSTEIPWSGDVYTRSKQLERGDWGAAGAADAVTRTLAAVITNAVVAATVLPRT